MLNTIQWDCHMHSFYSADSDTPIEEMVQKGIQCNLKGICFTEHIDPDYPDTPEKLDFSLDPDAYLDGFLSLKDKYKNQIELRFGIELGLQPHLANTFQELLKAYPFDFVIGSSHLLHGADPYYPEYFQGREELSVYQDYFESILENLSAYRNFDVYGHLDYIVRYGPNQNTFYSYKKYQDIIDEILHILIENQIGIELNTGGFHYGLGEPNPCREIIRRYREMGGEIITVGADAHAPGKIAYSFPKAYSILKECGFKYYTTFKDRKPEFLIL